MQGRDWVEMGRRREFGGGAEVVQIAVVVSYHGAGARWKVYIGDICGVCGLQH
jgi:hypothetical protein